MLAKSQNEKPTTSLYAIRACITIYLYVRTHMRIHFKGNPFYSSAGSIHNMYVFHIISVYDNIIMMVKYINIIRYIVAKYFHKIIQNHTINRK